MSRSTRSLCAVLAAFVLVLAVCGDDDNAAVDRGAVPTTAGAPTDVGDGDGCAAEHELDRLTMGVFSDTGGLDPVVARGTGLVGDTENAALYDVLVRWDEARGEYMPQLAASLEPNDTFDEWTLVLREGITFGNGDAVDAEAVKASIERHMDPRAAPPRPARRPTSPRSWSWTTTRCSSCSPTPGASSRTCWPARWA